MRFRISYFIFILISIFFIRQKSKAQGYFDVGVTAVIQPTCSAPPGTLQDVIVVITNFGTTSITTVPVMFSFNGGLPTTVTYAGFIPPLGSDTLVTLALVMIPLSPYTFCSFTDGDTIPSNDTTCICNGNPMSVNSDLGNFNLLITPNPSHGQFSINFGELQEINTTISVTDHLGRLVWNSDFIKPEFDIDLSDKPEGLYFLQLKTPSTVFTSKLIICK
jgi:hypothetical protein